VNTLEKLRAGKLAGTTRLTLANGLTSFPAEIFELADTLEILDLSNNALSSLPDDFSCLTRLRILFCNHNQFKALPAILGQCPQLSMISFRANQIEQLSAAALPVKLRWLTLTDNRLSELPPELGRCFSLQKLMLAGNQLTHLPDSLANCIHLELMRLSVNQLVELPLWLTELPSLAWLAYAGNPFCAEKEATALMENTLPAVEWACLTLQDKIGEGASGKIYQARWQNADERSVAVKLFKGTLTSDGLPQNEMACCIAAGAHPNLIPLHGKISGHPAHQLGLVMSLIDDSFENLAEPPSLDSCTRDCYPAEKNITFQMMMNIVTGIASAVQQLHIRGILHGDLYAHNILFNDQGQALLGDFGAASLLPVNVIEARRLQQIEVRAFGILLAEVLACCECLPETESLLRSLIGQCVQSDANQRPLLDAVLAVLESVKV
jgi:hypothetical protein